MDFLGNLVINSICMAILVVLFFANIKNTRGKIFGPRMFQFIISSGILLFAVDIIGRMDGLTSLSIPPRQSNRQFPALCSQSPPSHLVAHLCHLSGGGRY